MFLDVGSHIQRSEVNYSTILYFSSLFLVFYVLCFLILYQFFSYSGSQKE